MYFKEWIVKRKVFNTPNGDFILDVRQDFLFPFSNDKQIIREYLHDSSDETKNAFEYWFSLFMKDTSAHGINEWINYKCQVCGCEFPCCNVDGGLNEHIKHERPLDSKDRSRIVVFFSHWNRARTALSADKSICFTCYCKERLNPNSEYIKRGHSFLN